MIKKIVTVVLSIWGWIVIGMFSWMSLFSPPGYPKGDFFIPLAIFVLIFTIPTTIFAIIDKSS